jgi:hypothetical protein
MVRRPSWRLAAVVLGGLLVVTVIASLRGNDDADEPEAPPAEAFLEALARSRSATYRSIADFTRTSNSTGAVLNYRLIVAQRPPDRLRIDQSGATGLVDGQRLACTFRDDELSCDEADARVTLEEETADQLAAYRSYVRGDTPLYAVEVERATDAGDCFELSLQREMVAPPLGIVSRYCFDAATGAPTDQRVEAVEAVDVIDVVQLAGEVTDADLDPATALG